MRRNPFIPTSAWQAKATAVTLSVEREKQLQAEYQRLLPRLDGLYEGLSPREKSALEELDRRSRDGDWEPLIRWTRARIPGAFKLRRGRPAALSSRRTVVPAEPLKDMPRLVYHGTRDLPSLLTRGFSLPPATELDAHAGVDTYCWICKGIRSDFAGFPIRWGSILWGWYRGLPRAGRDTLQRQAQQSIKSIADLGDAISLLWAGESPRLAQEYTKDGYPVVEIDTTKMPVYGWTEPDMAGKDEIVLILPSSGWQGGPDAITRLWVPE